MLPHVRARGWLAISPLSFCVGGLGTRQEKRVEYSNTITVLMESSAAELRSLENARDSPVIPSVHVHCTSCQLATNYLTDRKYLYVRFIIKIGDTSSTSTIYTTSLRLLLSSAIYRSGSQETHWLHV